MGWLPERSAAALRLGLLPSISLTLSTQPVSTTDSHLFQAEIPRQEHNSTIAMAWTGTPQAAGSAPQAAAKSSQDPDTTIPQKLHLSSKLASTSTPHEATTAQQA